MQAALANLTIYAALMAVSAIDNPRHLLRHEFVAPAPSTPPGTQPTPRPIYVASSLFRDVVGMQKSPLRMAKQIFTLWGFFSVLQWGLG
jgi:hypothetical protein